MEFRSGDLLARIVQDVGTLENFYIRVVSPPITAVLIAAATALFLASRSPLLALNLLAFFLLLGLVLPLLSQQVTRRASREVIRRRAGLNVLLVDGIHGLADLLAFNRAAGTLDTLASASRDYGDSQNRIARLNGLFSGLNIFLTNLGLWMVLWIAIPLVDAGRLNGVMLASLALLTLASFEAVTPLPLAAQTWNLVREAAGRLFEVVDARPEVLDKAHMLELPPAPEVEFAGLSFTYPGEAAPALEGIDFTS